MIPLIIAIVVVAIGFVFLFRPWEDEFEGAYVWVTAIIFALLLSNVVVGVVWAIGREATDHEVLTEKKNLTAVATGSHVSGRMFLGSGTVGENTVYTYAVERADGGYYLENVKASSAVVYEIPSGDQPYIQGVGSDSDFFSIPWYDGADFSNATRYNIYVPEGSVYEGYSVDVRDGS